MSFKLALRLRRRKYVNMNNVELWDFVKSRFEAIEKRQEEFSSKLDNCMDTIRTEIKALRLDANERFSPLESAKTRMSTVAGLLNACWVVGVSIAVILVPILIHIYF